MMSVKCGPLMLSEAAPSLSRIESVAMRKKAQRSTLMVVYLKFMVKKKQQSPRFNHPVGEL